MDEIWQQFATLDEKSESFARVFHPSMTLWGADKNPITYQTKWETLKLCFLESQTKYLGVVREYIQWCDETISDVRNYLIDTPFKVRKYLEVRVANAIQRWHDDKADGNVRTSLVEECAFNSFRIAIPALDALAKWQGYTFTTLLDEEVIYSFRTMLMRKQWIARGQVRDYASSSRFVCKRITEEETEDIITAWWSGAASDYMAGTALGKERAQMRGILLHCLQSSIGRRGADMRNLRISMMFSHSLPNIRPVVSCPVIGMSLRHVKECRDNVEHLLGWTRSRNRWECPLGALAAYLVWMNDIADINVLDAIKRDIETEDDTKQWWNLMLISASDRSEPISYTTHRHHTSAGFVATNATAKTACTHIYRNDTACKLIENGLSIEDVGLYQGWYHDCAADRYLRASFKTQPLLVSHGWEEGTHGFSCWWEGNESDIPDEVKHVIFPGLDELAAQAKQRYDRNKKDRSAVEVTRALQLLRRIFIEDSVIKRPVYPTFPAYSRHPLFADPSFHRALEAWEDYKQAETQRIETREKAWMMQKNGAISEIMKEALAQYVAETGIVIGDNPRTVQLSNIPIVKPPPEVARIPEIKEPVDLYSCYQEWQRVRSYFYEVSLPPWKKQFGEMATAMKLRYSRMRPFLMYLDRCGDGAREYLHRLEAIRKKYDIHPAVFIKQCFYYMAFPPSSAAKTKPCISPQQMQVELQENGMPLLT